MVRYNPPIYSLPRIPQDLPHACFLFPFADNAEEIAWAGGVPALSDLLQYATTEETKAVAARALGNLAGNESE